MCIQCMGVAVAAVGTASGSRAWISSKLGGRLGSRGMRAVTFVLIAAAVIVSSVGLGGSGG